MLYVILLVGWVWFWVFFWLGKGECVFNQIADLGVWETWIASFVAVFLS